MLHLLQLAPSSLKFSRLWRAHTYVIIKENDRKHKWTNKEAIEQIRKTLEKTIEHIRGNGWKHWENNRKHKENNRTKQ